MKFEEAMKAMREGKNIRRPKWRVNAHYKIISLMVDENNSNADILMLDDLIAEDWEIVE